MVFGRWRLPLGTLKSHSYYLRAAVDWDWSSGSSMLEGSWSSEDFHTCKVQDRDKAVEGRAAA